jgi:hypothetical protein
MRVVDYIEIQLRSEFGNEQSGWGHTRSVEDCRQAGGVRKGLGGIVGVLLSRRGSGERLHPAESDSGQLAGLGGPEDRRGEAIHDTRARTVLVSG